MTLRRRICLCYSITLGVALLVVGFWSWFEFREQRNAVLRGGVAAARNENPVEESLEIIAYGGLPAMLLGLGIGTLLIRRTLRPIEELTEVLESTNASNLYELVPRSENGDEIDRMTAVFNDMKNRLGASLTQAREFTQHASHELKTPLTIMHSTLEHMLNDSTASASHREHVTTLLEEVQRLSNIVSQLAFLAKADAGQLAILRRPLALDELVRDVAEDTIILAASASINVSLDQCDNVQIEGDRARLRQLLLNLCDNAVKHNHEGGSISISLDQWGESARIRIINTGTVLPAELYARVFDRFFRGDPAHSLLVEGSGLGLSIADSIARAHGGTLSMEATPDARTCVTLTLPLPSAGAPVLPV